MPRFYSSRDTDFYAEQLIDKHCKETPEKVNHILRRNPLRNIFWFRDQDNANPNHSFICSWGNNEIYQENTGYNSKDYYEHRFRRKPMQPLGALVLWRITRKIQKQELEQTLDQSDL